MADPNVLWFLSLVILFAITVALLEIKKRTRDSQLTVVINFGFIAALAISTALTGLDPVAFVGFFGAYAIILSVHLGIAAATPKA